MTRFDPPLTGFDPPVPPAPWKCRGCGCTDDQACPGGCWWEEPNWCSACAALALAPPRMPGTMTAITPEDAARMRRLLAEGMRARLENDQVTLRRVAAELDEMSERVVTVFVPPRPQRRRDRIRRLLRWRR